MDWKLYFMQVLSVALIIGFLHMFVHNQILSFAWTKPSAFDALGMRLNYLSPQSPAAPSTHIITLTTSLHGSLHDLYNIYFFLHKQIKQTGQAG